MQHIHILGVCGTFMAGIAQLAKAMGHKVTGSDVNVYPPMSTQLEQAGIQIMQGYKSDNLNPRPDMVLVGNAISRGNPELEYILNEQIPYTNAPAWLYQQHLSKCWVIGVSGTHGKTTTTSMVAWILEQAGLNPGFLVGGVPQNFGLSARIGGGKYFVIESDEYDTAFDDKRSKFVHYHPKTLILNNLEYDHADIFENLLAIEKQFHQLIRAMPSNGQIIAPYGVDAIEHVFSMGCWTPIVYTGDNKIFAQKRSNGLFIFVNGQEIGELKWSLIGEHNIQNALSAIAACYHVGVPPQDSIKALASFLNVARRMQYKGECNDIALYDDFAHHPTAIELTLNGFREKVGDSRIIALVDLASNSMKLNTHQDTLAPSLANADIVFIRQSPQIQWSPAQKMASLGDKLKVFNESDDLLKALLEVVQQGDKILCMSNSSFGGLTEKILPAIKAHIGAPLT